MIARLSSGSRTLNRPAWTAASMSRRAHGASPLSEPTRARPLCSNTLLNSCSRRCRRAASRKLWGNSAGVVEADDELVEPGAERVEGVLDRGVEELVLALEVL